MAVLVTGGAGYIGSAFVEQLLDGGRDGRRARRPLARAPRRGRPSRRLPGGPHRRPGARRAPRAGARHRRLRSLRGLRLRRRVRHRAGPLLREQLHPGRRALRGARRGRRASAWSSPRPAPPTACRARCRSRRATRSGRSTPTAGRSCSSSGCSPTSTAPTACASWRCATSTRRARRAQLRRGSRRPRRTSSRSSSPRRPAAAATGHRLRRRLRHARRHRHPRLHPRRGPRRGAPPRARVTCGGGGASQFLNLGNGTGYSVLEVIESARRVTGREVPYEKGPRREGDPPRLVGDARRAREVLGWTPRGPTSTASSAPPGSGCRRTRTATARSDVGRAASRCSARDREAAAGDAQRRGPSSGRQRWPSRRTSASASLGPTLPGS